MRTAEFEMIMERREVITSLITVNVEAKSEDEARGIVGLDRPREDQLDMDKFVKSKQEGLLAVSNEKILIDPEDGVFVRILAMYRNI